MDLSNDESAFSNGEMNETIHVNSHIEEKFIMEDVGMYFSSNSDDKSDIIMIGNAEELKDPMLWERFDKDVSDFTIEEVRKSRFKSLELGGEFLQILCKNQRFWSAGE